MISLFLSVCLSVCLSVHRFALITQQEESARERALCQLTECFSFVKVIRGQNNYQEKGCTEIQ